VTTDLRRAARCFSFENEVRAVAYPANLFEQRNF